MTEPAKKAPAKKRAPRAKKAVAAKTVETEGKFAGYTRDSRGNLSDPWTEAFQACIREGRRWEGPPK